MDGQSADISEYTISRYNASGIEVWIKGKARLCAQGSKVLDVGAGAAPYRNFFRHCDYQAHDFCKNPEHVPYSSYITIVSDITAIPVADETFDSVLCTEVFEHIPEPIKAIKEIARILKK